MSTKEGTKQGDPSIKKSCAKCRNHLLNSELPDLKGHKHYCNYSTCPCSLCASTTSRRIKMRDSVAERRKKAIDEERKKDLPDKEKSSPTSPFFRSINKLKRKLQCKDDEPSKEGSKRSRVGQQGEEGKPGMTVHAAQPLVAREKRVNETSEVSCVSVSCVSGEQGKPGMTVHAAQPLVPVISWYPAGSPDYCMPYGNHVPPSCYRITLPTINTYYYQSYYHEDGKKHTGLTDNDILPPITPLNYSGTKLLQGRMMKVLQTLSERKVIYKKIGMSACRKLY